MPFRISIRKIQPSNPDFHNLFGILCRGASRTYVSVYAAICKFERPTRWPSFRAFSETDFWIYSVTLYCRQSESLVKYLRGMFM